MPRFDLLPRLRAPEPPPERAATPTRPFNAAGQPAWRPRERPSADVVKPLTFADLLAMQYRGDGTMALMDGLRTRLLVTVFTRLRQPAVRIVVADAQTRAIRARRHFFSLGEAISFANEALLA